MPSQGPLSPSTIVSDSGIGVNAWVNPGNASASDNTEAAAAGHATQPSQWLKATNFGFTIPTGATITGVVVEVERRYSASGQATDFRVELVEGGVIGSTNKADTVNTWPTTEAIKSYGSSSDLWGLSLTRDDVNASNFGVALSVGTAPLGGAVGALVDHIKVTVHYVEAQTVTLAGIDSASSLGSLALFVWNTLTLAGIDSGSTLGALEVVRDSFVTLSSIDSASTIGTHRINTSSAPTNLDPLDEQIRSRLVANTFTWQFNDAEGDAQAAWAFKRVVV